MVKDFVFYIALIGLGVFLEAQYDVSDRVSDLTSKSLVEKVKDFGTKTKKAIKREIGSAVDEK